MPGNEESLSWDLQLRQPTIQMPIVEPQANPNSQTEQGFRVLGFRVQGLGQAPTLPKGPEPSPFEQTLAIRPPPPPPPPGLKRKPCEAVIRTLNPKP